MNSKEWVSGSSLDDNLYLQHSSPDDLDAIARHRAQTVEAAIRSCGEASDEAIEFARRVATKVAVYIGAVEHERCAQLCADLEMEMADRDPSEDASGFDCENRIRAFSKDFVEGSSQDI